MDSELERLDEIGGVVTLAGHRPAEPELFQRINLYPDELVPILQEYSSAGPDWARRHWPLVALACDSWRTTSKIHADRGPIGLTPSDIRRTFDRIAKSANKIVADMVTLQGASISVAGNEQDKAGHVAWLLHALCLIQDYEITLDQVRETQESDEWIAKGYWSQRELFARLGRLSGAAVGLRDFARSDLLTAGPPTIDPALSDLVERLGEVWISLAGRQPSVSKAGSKPKSSQDSEVNGGSPFVRFVQAVASVQVAAAREERPGSWWGRPFEMTAPTFHMIETALRHTCFGAEKNMS